jgi:polysaccharide biosynthesis protein VpsM
LSDRDLRTRNASLRLGVNLGSRIQLFTQISGNTLTYLGSASDLRNSSGYSVLVGSKLQVTNLVNLEAGVGYIWHDFNNPAFKPVKAINFHLAGNWTPTSSWLVTASAERAIDGSPIAVVPAIFRTSYMLGAKHTLGDRFLLGANIAAVREDYREIARVDQRYQFGITFQYRLTNHIGLQATADYRQQDGGLNGRSYAGEMVLIALRIVG